MGPKKKKRPPEAAKKKLGRRRRPKSIRQTSFGGRRRRREGLDGGKGVPGRGGGHSWDRGERDRSVHNHTSAHRTDWRLTTLPRIP